MNWYRVKISVLHSYYHLLHSMETWVDLLWFSLIDVCVFGLMSRYFAQSAADAQFLIIGIVLWEVVRVGQYGVTVGLLWEVWSKSFSSLFISPLTVWEFILGQVISGLLKAVGVFILLAIMVKVFFGFSMLILGGWLLPYFAILYIFSVAAGIFILGLIVRYGTTIQSLAWGLIFLFQPLSAIFYPLNVLPDFIRTLAYISPIMYVMESARGQISGVSPDPKFVLLGATLSLGYLVLSVIYARAMLGWARRTGAFARMGN